MRQTKHPQHAPNKQGVNSEQHTAIKKILELANLAGDRQQAQREHAEASSDTKRKSVGATAATITREADRWVISYYIESRRNSIEQMVYFRAHDKKSGERVDDKATFAKSFTHYFESSKKYAELSAQDKKLLTQGAAILREILREDPELRKQYGERLYKLEKAADLPKKSGIKLI